MSWIFIIIIVLQISPAQQSNGWSSDLRRLLHLPLIFVWALQLPGSRWLLVLLLETNHLCHRLQRILRPLLDWGNSLSPLSRGCTSEQAARSKPGRLVVGDLINFQPDFGKSFFDHRHYYSLTSFSVPGATSDVGPCYFELFHAHGHYMEGCMDGESADLFCSNVFENFWLNLTPYASLWFLWGDQYYYSLLL
jgi:hypothetical protein